ncbi:MAG: hypothetical protein AB7J28_03290 [Hyphomonadaceae bacterium]
MSRILLITALAAAVVSCAPSAREAREGELSQADRAAMLDTARIREEGGRYVMDMVCAQSGADIDFLILDVGGDVGAAPALRIGAPACYGEAGAMITVFRRTDSALDVVLSEIAAGVTIESNRTAGVRDLALDAGQEAPRLYRWTGARYEPAPR